MFSGSPYNYQKSLPLPKFCTYQGMLSRRINFILLNVDLKYDNICMFLTCPRLESASFFCKAPGSKYFRICEPYSLCHNLCNSVLSYKNSCSQYINIWVWHVPKIHYQKQSMGQIWPLGYILLTPVLRLPINNLVNIT